MVAFVCRMPIAKYRYTNKSNSSCHRIDSIDRRIFIHFGRASRIQISRLQNVHREFSERICISNDIENGMAISKQLPNSIRSIFFSFSFALFIAQMTAPSRVMFLFSCCLMMTIPPLRIFCLTELDDHVCVVIMLTTAPYFLFFCR